MGSREGACAQSSIGTNQPTPPDQNLQSCPEEERERERAERRPSPSPPRPDSSSPSEGSAGILRTASTPPESDPAPQSTWRLSWSTSPRRSSSWPETPPGTTRRPGSSQGTSSSPSGTTRSSASSCPPSPSPAVVSCQTSTPFFSQRSPARSPTKFAQQASCRRRQQHFQGLCRETRTPQNQK